MTQRPISVYLVDDHDIFRAGTKTFLADFEILGEASTSPDAITGILESQPDVALIDVHIDSPRSGAGVVEAVKQANPDIKCVALTVSASRRDVAACLAADVDGYLTKDFSGAELPDAIRDVMSGGTPISPEVASYVLDIDIVAEQDKFDLLTPREREVVTYMARGYTYRECASELGMKVKTLESHMSHIFQKLGVATRHQLAYLVHEQDILDPDDDEL